MFSRTANMQNLNACIAVVIAAIPSSRTFWKAIDYCHVRVTGLNSSRHLSLHHLKKTRISTVIVSYLLVEHKVRARSVI